MKSFNTDYTVNPYDTFAHNFAMAMKSPALHLLNEWLTGVPDSTLSDPIVFKQGHWILCGYGRLGQRLYEILKQHKLSVTIIDTKPQLEYEFKARYATDKTKFIVGTGTDQDALKEAGIDYAVGLIAGSDNDSNNLSAVMTAQMLNSDLIVLARQNEMVNKRLFLSAKTDIIMHPSEIVARRIRTLLTNPLLIDFLEQCFAQNEEWINITISKLSGAIGELTPHCWTNNLTAKKSPAMYSTLTKGRIIRLKNILRSPMSKSKWICCLPLMIKRRKEIFLLPENDFILEAYDQILFCGRPEAEAHISQCMHDVHTLNYVTTLKATPDSFLGRLLSGELRKKRRLKDQESKS
jgi:Trk K+ transport system NAD-binding subunit